MAKKKSASKKPSKSGSAPKVTKPKAPPKPKAPTGSNDNAVPAAAQQLEQMQQQLQQSPPPQKPTADQMVLALANAICNVLNGQNAAVAMNALGAATARICLTTKTNSASFGQLLTAQIEVQAQLMLEERAAAPLPVSPPPATTPPKGRGRKKKVK